MPLVAWSLGLAAIALLVALSLLFVRLARRKKARSVALLAGLLAGSLAWAGITLWPASPVAGGVCVALALGLAILVRALQARVFSGVGAVAFAHTLIAAGVTLAALLLVFQGAFLAWLNTPVVSDLEVINPGGFVGTALAIYHPDRRDVQAQLTRAFAESLADNGWRVELTTASPEAPTNVVDYELLVLGAPTYLGRPAGRIHRYLREAGDLMGQPTVLIVSGAGLSRTPATTLERWTAGAGGLVVKTLEIWTLASNAPLYGADSPDVIMRQAAAELPVYK
ncbi:MAG: hypothetical protein JXB35_05695 [Anaerolineae bacterium]|nr:hypothetical protein [Anaerolineae bacterium]